MTIHISHRSTLAGRRPVKIDGELVGECRVLARRHGPGTEVLFFLPGGRESWARFDTMKDLRALLPGILDRATRMPALVPGIITVSPS